jgi:hypothetical protein
LEECWIIDLVVLPRWRLTHRLPRLVFLSALEDMRTRENAKKNNCGGWMRDEVLL